MEQRLSIITLGVRDLKKSRTFYDSLGWKVATEQSANDIVFYNMNGFVLALYPLDQFEEELGDPILPAGTKFTLAYNVESKQAVDSILNEIKTLGGKKVQDAKERSWGGYSGYFCDLDGHYWEVAFNPYSLPQNDGTFRI